MLYLPGRYFQHIQEENRDIHENLNLNQIQNCIRGDFFLRQPVLHQCTLYILTLGYLMNGFDKPIVLSLSLSETTVRNFRDTRVTRYRYVRVI